MRGGRGAFVLLTFVAGACSPYTLGERPDDPLSPSSAYIYGRFELDSRGSQNAMGFLVRCTDGAADRTFEIGFSTRHPLQVFKVAPGTCAIEGTVYTAGHLWPRGQRETPLAPLRDRELSAGVAYYVGNFVSGSIVRQVSSSKVRTTWGLTDIRNDYAGTTAEMKRMFPRLASLPTEDAMKRR